MNILEDFANIEYIFSDKTGTLTQNELIFKSLSVVAESSTIVCSGSGCEIAEKLEHDDNTYMFFKCLSVCHECFATHKDEEITYSG